MTQSSALSCWAVQHLYSWISLFPCLIYLKQKQLWWMHAAWWLTPEGWTQKEHTCPTHPPALNSSSYWQGFLTVLCPAHLCSQWTFLLFTVIWSSVLSEQVQYFDTRDGWLYSTAVLSLPDSHLLLWLFWSLMKVQFNSFFKKNQVSFSQSDVPLHQFCVRCGQSS